MSVRLSIYLYTQEIYCENLQKKAVEDSRNINSLGAIILKLRNKY